jgi:hypothetical protein
MKAALQYMVFVGISIVIVLIFVRIGEKYMSAPASIGGNWILEPDSKTGEAGFNCPALVFDDEPALSISQSGVYLEVTFNDRDHTSLSGMLTDLTVNAEKSTASGSTILEAEIDRQTEPDRLEGKLMVSSCQGPISLVGSRQPSVHQTSEGH